MNHFHLSIIERLSIGWYNRKCPLYRDVDSYSERLLSDDSGILCSV